MDNTTIKTVDELCLDRWRTLQSVDDLLEEVVMTLQVSGAHTVCVIHTRALKLRPLVS